MDSDNIERAFWIFAASSILAYTTKSEVIEFMTSFSRFSTQSREAVIRDFILLLEGNLEFQNRNMKELKGLLRKYGEKGVKFRNWRSAKQVLRESSRQGYNLQHMLTDYMWHSDTMTKQMAIDQFENNLFKACITGVFGKAGQYDKATAEYTRALMYDNMIASRILTLAKQSKHDRLAIEILILVKDRVFKKWDGKTSPIPLIAKVVNGYESSHKLTKMEAPPVDRINPEDLEREETRSKLLDGARSVFVEVSEDYFSGDMKKEDPIA